jgi:phenylalanine-4-hydroxylase
MHAHPVFANFLQSYGQVSASLTREQDIVRMSRLFWFTVEFGIIRQHGRIKLYGSGLISSHGESDHVIHGGPEIRDFKLDEVLDRDFNISEMQPVLYAVESFDQIYEATREARNRLG